MKKNSTFDHLYTIKNDTVNKIISTSNSVNQSDIHKSGFPELFSNQSCFEHCTK